MKTKKFLLLDLGVCLSVLQLFFGICCFTIAGPCYTNKIGSVPLSNCPQDPALLQDGTSSCPSQFNIQTPVSCSDNIQPAEVVIGTFGNEPSGLSSQEYSSTPCYKWVRCHAKIINNGDPVVYHCEKEETYDHGGFWPAMNATGGPCPE